MGVFAKNKLQKDDVIMVMGGRIMHTDEENQVGGFATNYNIDISDDWSFCPATQEELDLMPQHYINHSCDPNCGFKNVNQIVAIRDINRGEEIVYDYAFVMWSSDMSELHYELRCGCGSSFCRKIITESDWKNAELQKRFGPYFQSFLKDKFN